jgi:DNA-binding XRE family transcriptional regulator
MDTPLAGRTTLPCRLSVTPSAFYEDFGRRCRSARARAGLSQEVVAKRLGIARSGYGRIESGAYGTTVARWNCLAAMFDVQPAELWPGGIAACLSVAEQALSHVR